MDLDIPGQEQARAPAQNPQKGSVLLRNDQKWESLKQEIRAVYVTKNNTLPQTMLWFEEAHDFKAS
jgi:hypothetical protein